MVCFETNEYYSSLIAEELLLVVERTSNTVTFKRESGAEYTVKTDNIMKINTYTGEKYYVETAVVVPNMVFVSAEDKYE